jgi:hypothetical protein
VLTGREAEPGKEEKAGEGAAGGSGHVPQGTAAFAKGQKVPEAVPFRVRRIRFEANLSE